MARSLFLLQIFLQMMARDLTGFLQIHQNVKKITTNSFAKRGNTLENPCWGRYNLSDMVRSDCGENERKDKKTVKMINAIPADPKE